MRSKLFAVLFILLLAVNCLAQDADAPPALAPETPKAVKFGEFGDISEREFAPKLEKFKFAHLASRGASAFIVFYNSSANSPFRQSRYFIRWKIHSYARYQAHHERTVYVEGGFLDKMRTELWLVPEGADRPPLDSSARGPTSKFIGERISDRPIDLKPARIIKEKVEKYDGPYLDDREYPDEKPWMPDTAPFGTGDFSLDFLNKHSEAKGLVIFYLDEDVFDLPAAREMVEKKLKDHAAKVKVDPARVEVIFGGYRRYPELELWALPVGGPNPELLPDEKLSEN